jgi:hypothetical protein
MAVVLVEERGVVLQEDWESVGEEDELSSTELVDEDEDDES